MSFVSTQSESVIDRRRRVRSRDRKANRRRSNQVSVPNERVRVNDEKPHGLVDLSYSFLLVESFSYPVNQATGGAS